MTDNIKAGLITFTIMFIALSILFIYSLSVDQIVEPTPSITYSDFEPGFGLYIVNGVRITYDKLSDTQHMICIDNQPVRIHKTEEAAKSQMERLLEYYLDL